MKWLASFGRFWYDFIVGDDWTIAVEVILAVALTAAISRRGWNAWPILPVCVVVALAASLWRALRVHRRVATVEAPRDPKGTTC